MTLRSRYLAGVNSSSPATPKTEDERDDSDFVVILASLLCALICVLGLVAVARCAWIRRISGRVTGGSETPANKGLKKKILRTLPKITFPGAEDAGKFSDCAICLTEFVSGDELRVLPQCGHGFHVGCIDTWLGSHSTCPSCRQILVSSRCGKCGELPAENTVDGAQNEIRALPQRPDRIDTFLP